MQDKTSRVRRIGELNPWREDGEATARRSVSGSNNNTVASGVTAAAAVTSALAASAMAAISANPRNVGRVDRFRKDEEK